MPIFKDGDGVIQYTPIDSNLRWEDTGVIPYTTFGICHPSNVLKQVQFLVNPVTTDPGVLTLQADISGDSTINISSFAGTPNSFGVIQTDRGTFPSAEAPTDTLTLSSSNKSLYNEGNSTTDSVNFIVPNASPIEDNEAITALGSFTGRSSTANQWFGVAYSPERNLFVAIASSGTNRISISKDGFNWYDFAAPQNSLWSKVCWSPQLRLFCAVSFDGASRGMTSPDGINWTLRTLPGGSWYDICWSEELGLFCATSLSGGTGIATSPDGITWTAQTVSGVSTNFYTVCWSPQLSLFVAIRLNGSAYTSPDGVNWTARTISNKSWSSVCWSPYLRMFCAVGTTGTNRCDTSYDGITWTSRAIQANSWRSVCWANELGCFVAVASGGQLSYSFNGITWVAGTAPQASNQWYEALWVKEAGLLVITGITGTNRIMTSKYTRDYNLGFKPFTNTIVIRDSNTSISIAGTHRDSHVLLTSASAVTITAPSNSTLAFAIGTVVHYYRYGAGTVTFAAGAGATIVSRGSLLSIDGQYGKATITKIAVDEWLLEGDLV